MSWLRCATFRLLSELLFYAVTNFKWRYESELKVDFDEKKFASQVNCKSYLLSTNEIEKLEMHLHWTLNGRGGYEEKAEGGRGRGGDWHKRISNFRNEVVAVHFSIPLTLKEMVSNNSRVFGGWMPSSAMLDVHLNLIEEAGAASCV